MKLVPITIMNPNGDVEDVLFDITIIINKNNEATIVDNNKFDVKDFVDCNTLVMKQVKISV